MGMLWGDAEANRAGREGLSEEVTFEMRLEGSDEVTGGTASAKAPWQEWPRAGGCREGGTGRPGLGSQVPCIWEGAWTNQGPEREAACPTLQPSQASPPPSGSPRNLRRGWEPCQAGGGGTARPARSSSCQPARAASPDGAHLLTRPWAGLWFPPCSVPASRNGAAGRGRLGKHVAAGGACQDAWG